MADVPTPDVIARSCLCLAVRKAARATARRYDEALRPFGLTSGQFSILVAIAAGSGTISGRLAEALGVDRTTLTAALKPLERDGLVVSGRDPGDGRARRLSLTASGTARLAAAVPAWQRAQAALAREVGAAPDRLRVVLEDLAA